MWKEVFWQQTPCFTTYWVIKSIGMHRYMSCICQLSNWNLYLWMIFFLIPNRLWTMEVIWSSLGEGKCSHHLYSIDQSIFQTYDCWLNSLEGFLIASLLVLCLYYLSSNSLKYYNQYVLLKIVLRLMLKKLDSISSLSLTSCETVGNFLNF